MSALDELLAQIRGATPEEREELEGMTKALAQERNLRWIPSPGPQTEAYYCEADILLYGGEAGGGKSDLLLGLAFNEHHDSLIMRREGVELSALTSRAIQINGTRKGFNGSSPQKLLTSDGRKIDFGSAKDVGSEESHQGKAHDFLGFDEAVAFEELQIRFLMTWVRSTIDGQRTRCVLATNPPVREDGQFLISMFAPWLDPQYPNPAKPGELRWCVTTKDNEDVWVEGPGKHRAVDQSGSPETLRALSRTFIPSSVYDNPFLAKSEKYLATLDGLPEPYRSAFRDGNFLIGRRDDVLQCIPTAWVREAQRRWTPQTPVGIPMCAIGADVAMGGKDNLVFAPRHDWWYAPLIKIPGAQITDGNDIAGRIIAIRFDGARVVIDCGGGFGSEAYGQLRENGVDAVAWLGVNSTKQRSKDGKFGFTNLRSWAIWSFREALDPGQPGGSAIALPPSPTLVADLTAPRYDLTSRGIAVESKEDVCKRLGRSTDEGDAVVMAWTEGAKQFMQAGGWEEFGRRRNRPQVNFGPRGPMGRR